MLSLSGNHKIFEACVSVLAYFVLIELRKVGMGKLIVLNFRFVTVSLELRQFVLPSYGTSLSASNIFEFKLRLDRLFICRTTYNTHLR